MKVTNQNIEEIKYISEYNSLEKGKKYLENLLIDLAELNQLIEDQFNEDKKLYIDIETEHTEYSPERIDPCPDYFGYFTLRFESNHYECVYSYMSLNELDIILCSLIEFLRFKV